MSDTCRENFVSHKEEVANEEKGILLHSCFFPVERKLKFPVFLHRLLLQSGRLVRESEITTREQQQTLKEPNERVSLL